MSIDNAIIEYKRIVRSLNEIRELLRTKLIQIGVPINGYPSLNTLMLKVNPTDINSVVNKNLPNIPIDTTQHFGSQQDIHNYLHNNFILSRANLLLIRKFLFYNEYLKHQLSNMGVSETEIKNATTLKSLILLLDRVERKRKVYVTSGSEIVYINKDTEIEITIRDDTDEFVQDGIIKIYLGSQTTGTPYKIYQLKDPFLINVSEPGQYTFTIEYVNTNLDGSINYNLYQPTEPITITLKAVYELLDGTISAKNMNNKSKYFWMNKGEVAGYENDFWDLDIQITNIEGENINRAIPFDIYAGDTNHKVTSGVTDTLGYSHMSNVQIPYCSSEFIDFREEAISKFAAIDIDFYVNDDDVLDSLSFIKNPKIVDNVITYQRINFTGENTLNELNGCITEIRLVDGKLRYTTFYTTQNIKIKNVDNLVDKIGSFVTEIFYNKTVFDYETVSNKKYEYTKDIVVKNIDLILQTKINIPEYPDIKIDTPINIYHMPISIDDSYLTWYKTDPEIPSTIPIVFHDEYTGETVDHIDNIFYIGVNDRYNLVNTPIYHCPIDINNLPYGENNFNITLSYRPLELDFIKEDNVVQNNITKNIGHIIVTDHNRNPISGQEVKFYEIKDEIFDMIFSMDIVITILSNFILPSKTLYYLSDAPEIYYKPKGITQAGEKVRYEVEESNWYGQTFTNEYGILKDLNWGVPREYILHLFADSHGLTEEVEFVYETKKPFDISIINYNKTQNITYELKVYDIENFNWNDTIDLNNYVIVKNGNNNISYTYTSVITDTEAIYNINIPSNSSTYGTNTIEVTINGYTETLSFLLYQYLFELETITAHLGNQTIQIRTLDPDVTTINISGDGITQKSVTKVGNIFYINCEITKAAPNGTILTINDNQGTIETLTISIPKSDIEIIYESFTTIFFTDEEIRAELQIQEVPVNDTITIIFNDGKKIFSRNYNIGKNVLNDNIVLADTPGTYVTSVTFVGNNNYESFVKEIEYTVIEHNTYVSDIYTDNNPNLTVETYTGRYDIKELVNDGDIIETGDLEINIEINKKERDIVIDAYINEEGNIVLVRYKDIHQYLLDLKLNKQDNLVASIYPAKYQTTESINNITLDREGILNITSQINENEEDIIMSLEINDEGVLIYKKLNDMDL